MVFKLDAIASIGSAVALVIFTLITAAHLRIRAETGANLLMLILAIVAAGAVFVTFVFTTLIHEPASIATLAGILRAERRSGLRMETLPRHQDEECPARALGQPRPCGQLNRPEELR